jgi:hypothetical protein
MLSLLLIAAAPIAMPVQEAVPAAETAQAKKICKRSQDTGSRLLSRPVCKTQAEWDAEARAGDDQVRRQTNRPNQ